MDSTDRGVPPSGNDKDKPKAQPPADPFATCNVPPPDSQAPQSQPPKSPTEKEAPPAAVDSWASLPPPPTPSATNNDPTHDDKTPPADAWASLALPPSQPEPSRNPSGNIVDDSNRATAPLPDPSNAADPFATGTFTPKAPDVTGSFKPPSAAPGATGSFTPQASGIARKPIPPIPPAAKYPTVEGYEILATLGKGGMGVVYKARDIKLKRLVALKMILAGAHAVEEDLKRFRIEAEAVARVQHPNIVQIYEIGNQDGRPFFSLEFVDGGPLDKRSPASRSPCSTPPRSSRPSPTPCTLLTSTASSIAT